MASLPKSVSQNEYQAGLESLLQERIAAGLAGEVSSKSLAAIVKVEMLSPISDDERLKRPKADHSPNRLLNDRAKADDVCNRLMSVPGVGPITAPTFSATIEDPHRFARSEDVGAYAGLVPRRSQSGERDVSGHISKAGDPMLRKALYKAANVALSQVKRPFALQEWGRKMVEAKGAKHARTAVARKLAALLHSLWLNETEFRWA